MSFSVTQSCGACKLAPECTDGDLIRGAVDVIHTGASKGTHKGGGEITMECFNFEAREE